LFTVPEGTKVTEKLFGKVLLSTVCSILLCIVCLVSTTWAWFTLEIENTGNEITIAKVTPSIQILLEGSELSHNGENVYTLNEDTYSVVLQLNNEATGPDDLNQNCGKAYVLMLVSHSDKLHSYYFTFDKAMDAQKHASQLQILGGTATVSFYVSWVAPASAEAVGRETIVIGTAAPGPDEQPSPDPDAIA
jgi:hypothetical protein